MQTTQEPPTYTRSAQQTQQTQQPVRTPPLNTEELQVTLHYFHTNKKLNIRNEHNSIVCGSDPQSLW